MVLRDVEGRLLSLVTLLLCASIVHAFQFPFSASDQQSVSTSHLPASNNNNLNTYALTLRESLHFSPTNRSLPILYQTYSEQDRISLQSITGHSSTQSLSVTRTRSWKPNSNHAYQAARRSSFYTSRALAQGRGLTASEISDSIWGATLEWQEEEIEVPDVSDVHTLANLAKMTSNAYTTPDHGDWYSLKGKWNISDSFGWLEDGLRGHVFADETNSTVVIAIKGTSAAIVGGGSGTGHKDKVNDNLLFSCCCARIDWSWSTVCDCYSSPYTCRQDCIEEAVMMESAYYPVATDLYNNVSALYPHAQIWLAGHSLGGGLASLLSLTYGVPSISFESPGDLLAARRLHLPVPPNQTYSSTNITTHVYHTADPIAMGVCNGALSSCAVAGFALETRCHTGKSILYDTVDKLGWSVDIRTHRINAVIENLLIEDWVKGPSSGTLPQKRSSTSWGWWPGKSGKKKKGDDTEDGGTGGPNPDDDTTHKDRGVPSPSSEEDCVDCFKWDFVDGLI